jgi:hypothetical protein
VRDVIPPAVKAQAGWDCLEIECLFVVSLSYPLRA